MLEVNSETRLFGLLGYKIGYTLSPAIHNYVFRKTGFNGVYLAFDTPPFSVDDAIRGLMTLAEGFNVTIPYKEVVLKHLESLHDTAAKTMAVNTVWRRTGYNTDYMAVKELIARRFGELWGMTCVVGGAGGAAKASALALAELGCSIVIIARTKSRAEELAAHLSNQSYQVRVEDRCDDRYDVVLNATPNPEWLIEKGCRARRLTVDLVYRPVITKLVESALRDNVGVVTGLDVLVKQALLAQSIWRGVSLDYMEEEVKNHLCRGILSGECLE